MSSLHSRLFCYLTCAPKRVQFPKGIQLTLNNYHPITASPKLLKDNNLGDCETKIKSPDQEKEYEHSKFMKESQALPSLIISFV